MQICTEPHTLYLSKAWVGRFLDVKEQKSVEEKKGIYLNYQ